MPRCTMPCVPSAPKRQCRRREPLRFAAGAIDHVVLLPVAGAVAFGAYQPSLGLQAAGLRGLGRLFHDP